jgi:phosphoglycolate phosphatase
VNAQFLKGVRALAIDLDGTLVDTAPEFRIALNRMLDQLRLPQVDMDDVVRNVGKGTAHLVRSILAMFLQGEQLEQCFDPALALYHAHYEEINGQHSSLYPGVREGLAEMRELGLRLACVTNKPAAFARQLLERTDLMPCFELLYGGDSLPRKKPDPLPMLQVMQDFALQPQQLLAVGDSSNDAQAARAAGCKIVVVPYGYNHGLPVQTIDADGIVATLKEAAGLLKAAASL